MARADWVHSIGRDPNSLKSGIQNQSAADHYVDTMMAAMRAKVQDNTVKDRNFSAFKEAYIKVRTDNIVLDHQSAIALVRMIHAEADTLTIEDIE